ncbi:hypothetical protein VN12_26735 [Pirellula sp. SH-Sr6A]|uniref:hypothetical protein n=1 Tax=Pirellula sp. SH-Sr6A TaxID=1632865 RepID=UPI00078B5D2F|nr:hypothetical protein [Pirellula sp. SH-Sr6A]AMV35718.1 hypothetical protein VN12_26735 [Pirellula sp. SH-Sr6A]
MANKAKIAKFVEAFNAQGRDLVLMEQIIDAVRADAVTGDPQSWVTNVLEDDHVLEAACTKIDKDFQNVLLKRIPTVSAAIKKLRAWEMMQREREREIRSA